MRCIAIIPARYQSVRFPGKPLADLFGRPLIQHVAEGCRRIPGIARVIVATDDERIADAARAAGAGAAMTPSDLPSGTDRVALVARDLDADVVLNVQGDEPLFDPGALGTALEQFVASAARYGTLRCPIVEFRELWNPNVVKVVVDGDGRALYFSRAPVPFPRQDWIDAGAARNGGAFAVAGSAVDGCWWQHVGVYMYRRSALAEWARIPRSLLEGVEGLEQLRILEAGEAMQTFVIARGHPGVDTPEDLERVRRHVEAAEGGA